MGNTERENLEGTDFKGNTAFNLYEFLTTIENIPFTFNRSDTLVSGFIADNGRLHDHIVDMLAPYGAART